MSNKGFTLIELIAVIVIMSIIALLATPNIVKMASNSKRESYVQSVKMFTNKAVYMYNQEQYSGLFDNGQIYLKDIKNIESDSFIDAYGCDFDKDNSYIVIKESTIDGLPVRTYDLHVKSSCDDKIYCVYVEGVSNINYIDKEMVTDQNCS